MAAAPVTSAAINLARIAPLTLLLSASLAPGAGLSEQEAAGRTIYQQGESPSGNSITARVGAVPFEVPGTALPCANCHGRDGRGRPEGGVVPPDIRWSELTKPYGHEHIYGRRHPPFDALSLKQAVALGLDPAGNELEPTMPRYTISGRDLDSLLAYLKRLEFLADPGVGAERLRLGTVLPLDGRFATMGRAIEAVLQAYCDAINRDGGLFGRKLELVVAKYGADAQSASANARKLVHEQDVFLLLAPFSAGWEAELGQLAAEEQMPVVAPVTLFPEDTRVSNLYMFHLLSGVSELAQALGSFAARHAGAQAAPAFVLHTATPEGGTLAQSLGQHLSSSGWQQVLEQPFVPGSVDIAGLVAEGRSRGVETVFVLGAGAHVRAIARAAADADWLPLLLVPGPLRTPDMVELPEQFGDKLFLAFPFAPTDQTPRARQRYDALFETAAQGRAYRTLQVPAYAAALTVAEVLKRSGRDLNRQQFVATFESLVDYDTGMLPPLTFNTDRRIGALGAHVMHIDSDGRLRPVGPFMSLQ
jgi:ABC-type branched-subunit amino acid transport system substrate-binding protein